MMQHCLKNEIVAIGKKMNNFRVPNFWQKNIEREELVSYHIDSIDHFPAQYVLA